MNHSAFPKILVLIMAHDTTDESFINYKKAWEKQILSQIYPIDFLYLYTDEKISNAYTIIGNCLFSKYPENYWDALLIKVLNGFDYFIKNQQYDYVFKTNLSTLINYDVFYKYCAEIDLSRKYVYDGVNGGNFVSGAGMLLNREAVKLVLENANLFNTSWTDDIFIGHILCTLNNVEIHSAGLPRYDVNKDVPLDELAIKQSSHVRIKIRVDDQDTKFTNQVLDILMNGHT